MTARTAKPKPTPADGKDPEVPAMEDVDVEARHEAELDEEELLKDLPALRSPLKLRQRHRSHLMRIFMAMSDDDGNLDTDTVTEEEMFSLLDQLDDFFESIADDRAEYDRWASGPIGTEDKLIAIMNRYMRALGE